MRVRRLLLTILCFPWYLLRFVWRKKWALVKAVFFLALLGGGAVAGLYYHYIVQYPGEEFDRDNIMNLFSAETPVYYDDGKTPIGVFFENEHRIYVPFEEIPKDFVNALIAAEDKNFYLHRGLDPLSVLRAAYVNFKAGKVVQGGSTLTQQTAKNLFKRKGRTFEDKLKELVQALRLEARYSKEDIIEFFANQFFVSGTGRGLGIAAKYFFDKPVNELALLECAFIAGSVRAPNRYNPLVQPSAVQAERAQRAAMVRKNYVVDNMYRLGMLDRAQYEALLKAPIPFKKGKIYHRLNVVMDFVREQLESDRFRDIFERHGISNLATSGVKIYTTVNRDLQRASLRFLRKGLSQVETKLQGYERSAVQERYAQTEKPEVKRPKIGQFVFGTVEAKSEKVRDLGLTVRIGERIGKVDEAGLLNLAGAFAQSRTGIWAQASPQEAVRLLGQIQVGDEVFVYVRGKSPQGKELLLDLEQKPRVEGGLVVSRKGEILAMAGGFENIYYNRAVEAKRQLGSIFKPLVFTAALQLGWTLLDPLENRRDLFVFQNQFYFPRPDHKSPYPRVSLAWAGVKSENVASVWLLYHLCDHLSFAQFKQVAELVDLAPRPQESYEAFKRRIRDSWGIVVTDESYRELAFATGKEEVITDLIFAGKPLEAEAVRFLKYGAGYDEYREMLRQAKEANRSDPEPPFLREFPLKARILKQHFLRFARLNGQMRSDWEYLKAGLPAPAGMGEGTGRFYAKVLNGGRVVAYGEGLGDKEFFPLGAEELRALAADSPDLPAEVLIEGEVRSSVLAMLAQAMERELANLKGQRPYDLATLWKIRDYRVLVGIRYVVKLCETLGFETPLEPVLSFPLGPNAVSIAEMGRAYGALTEGLRYADYRTVPPLDAVMVTRIVDPDGEEIYRALPQAETVVEYRVTAMLNEILRNVVNYGTASQAKDAVAMTLDLGGQGPPLVVNIPTLGKTGTANEYSNSSYVGFVPAFSAGKSDFALADAFVVIAYVGYDDNTPMKTRRLRIFGASGALPIWIDVANEIVNGPLYQRSVDQADFAFRTEPALAFPYPPEATPVLVDEGSGLPLSFEAASENLLQGATVYVYGQREGRTFNAQRLFSPLTLPLRPRFSGPLSFQGAQ